MSLQSTLNFRLNVVQFSFNTGKYQVKSIFFYQYIDCDLNIVLKYMCLNFAPYFHDFWRTDQTASDVSCQAVSGIESFHTNTTLYQPKFLFFNIFKLLLSIYAF